MPLAVVAMLTVGAFTVNASEIEKNIKKANSLVESVETINENDPYDGKVYYRYLDASTQEYKYVLVGEVEKGECSIQESDTRCSSFIDGMERNLWGELSPGQYIELHKIP